jgi:methanogenic corrinoid protein MtbC1
MSEPEHLDAGPRIRIGELSRRTGVRADTLRAWERRYGLLEPMRSDGGFRLYGPLDEHRVRTMSELLESGLSAAEAAGEARVSIPPPPVPVTALAGPGSDAAPRLLAALRAFDDAESNLILDEALAALSVEAVLSHLVLPVLEEIGDTWERGELSIGQEHFASNLLRGRLLGLGRNWGAGSGALALLACPPEELHDLGLLAFGLALRDRGWRIAYLGQDTPVETIRTAASELFPAAIVIAVLSERAAKSMASRLTELSAQFRLLLAGSGVDAELARRAGAELLTGDPVTAARELRPTPTA